VIRAIREVLAQTSVDQLRSNHGRLMNPFVAGHRNAHPSGRRCHSRCSSDRRVFDSIVRWARRTSADRVELIANAPAKSPYVLCTAENRTPKIVMRLKQIRSTIVTFAILLKRIDPIANAVAGYVTGRPALD
jgi:hypothetical protein